MTIYIHIAGIDMFELPLYITAEVDAAPQKGDLITMSEEQSDELRQKYIDNFEHLSFYNRENWKPYLFFTDSNADFDYRSLTKEDFEEVFNIDNATTVSQREFVISDDTMMAKGLHIYLSLQK